MKQVTLFVGMVAIIALLGGLLFVLLDISQNGITINLSGEVGLGAGVAPQIGGEITLVMPEPVDLIATGPDSGPVPADLSIAPCPKCGGKFIPIKWNAWTGDITWRCLDCGYIGEPAP